MAQQTQSPVPTALVLAIVVGLGFFAASKAGKPDVERDTTDVVTLRVTFEPTPRKAIVHVFAHVEDVKVADNPLLNSPWEKTITMPRGARVILEVSQLENATATCAILVNGTVVDANSRKDEGSFRCYANRPKK